MPRPLEAPLFDLPELELAGGVTHRNAVFLAERGLLPPPATGGGGKGKTRLWDVRGLKHIAVIGAMHAAGIELLLAARLLQAVAADHEENQGYGRLPVGLDNYLRLTGNHPSLDEVPSREEGDNDWPYHLWLRRYPGVYTPRIGQKHDWRIVIADRHHVYMGTGMPVLGMEEFGGYDPVARIDEWERGQEATVTAIELMEMPDGNITIPDDLRAEYLSARRDAIGIITANASLSIRVAMDKIADYRMDTG